MIEKKSSKECRVCVFIEAYEFRRQFEKRIDRRKVILDYKKLLNYIQEKYGSQTQIRLYFGLLREQEGLPLMSEELTSLLNYLMDLGYILINCDVFIESGKKNYYKRNKMIKKGSAISLSIDLICLGHNINDVYDKAVIFCGKKEKYKKAVELIEEKYNKEFEFLSLYDKRYQLPDEFKKLRDKLGISKSKLIIKNKKVLNLTSKYLEKFKTENPNINFDSKSLSEKPMVFINANNINDNLTKIREYNANIKNINLLEFFELLQKEFTDYKLLNKVELYLEQNSYFLLSSEDYSIGGKKVTLSEKLNIIGIDPYILKNEDRSLNQNISIEIWMAVKIFYNILEKKCDNIIICSGNTDFYPIITKIKDLNNDSKMNIDFEIWTFLTAIGNTLKTHIPENKIVYIENKLNWNISKPINLEIYKKDDRDPRILARKRNKEQKVEYKRYLKKIFSK